MDAERGSVALLTYVVARDYGFAPNPFHGYCTLATCKPIIRRVARVGDWIVGTGNASRKRNGRLVYAMQVREVLTFDHYWQDGRFRAKRPNLHGSKKQAFGDNIYFREPMGWHQEDSHHSLADGTPNIANITNDTQTDRVLIASEFVYWGGAGPQIPQALKQIVCPGRGHRRISDTKVVDEFVSWLRANGGKGFQGEPLDWKRTP